MSRRRDYGSGGVEARGANSWRLRYRIGGKIFRKTVHGNKTEAHKVLRQLLHAGDVGEHVGPSKVTLRQWAEHWLSIGAPGGKRRREVGARTLERYTELLHHVTTVLGDRPLQQLQSTEIDALYEKLGGRLSGGTLCNLQVTLGACITAAYRTRKLARNPMLELSKVPSRGETNHGMVLEAEQLRALVQGFKGSALYAIVATLAFTGARRNEALALQWGDLDVANKTLRIERAAEDTKQHGLRLKGPKTARGKRTIRIDDDLIALLLAERERHLRPVAGVPDGAAVDLSLVKLPEGALMFPKLPRRGESFSFTRLRKPRRVTSSFLRKATALGFPGLRLHDLRGTHETLLLDAGVPVHVVAGRCGHDAAVLLRSYAKRTRKADDTAVEAIAALAGSVLK
jgi:integrase